MKELDEIFQRFFGKVDVNSKEDFKEALISFATYDIKEQFPVDKYPERIVFDKKYEAIDLKTEKDKVRSYFVYKALGLKDVYKQVTNCGRTSFDPDNSTGTCHLTGQLYKKLWGFNYEYTTFGTINAFLDMDDGKKMLFGGECFNSLQSTILFNYGFDSVNCIKSMSKNEEDFLKRMKKTQIGKLFSVAHAPGNFGLVPMYFNRYRGNKSYIRDYLSPSLYVLQNPYLFNYGLKGKVKTLYHEYDKSMFNKYINTMYLWDLIKITDDKINVIDYNGKVINEIIDDYRLYKYKDVEEWSNFTTSFIIRRGIFMGALLYISYMYPLEYNDICKVLWQDEIINDNNKVGYDIVINEINKVMNKSEIKKIFVVVKELIRNF